MQRLFDDYDVHDQYDEMFSSHRCCRVGYKSIYAHLCSCSLDDVASLSTRARQYMMNRGIYFALGSDLERPIPFDIIPRIFLFEEWLHLERGLKQRLHALNLFIDDVYNEQKILADGIIPRQFVAQSVQYLKFFSGFSPRGNVWINISGSDVIRDRNGNFLVLEDNLRTPSGVSYVLETRKVQKEIFPDLLNKIQIRSVSTYADHLYRVLESSAHVRNPRIVLLTPGVYNSAYFEHVYLAEIMGIDLVENSDLFVSHGEVRMKNRVGKEVRVDVIYKRTDDEFLDPTVFYPHSLLGVPHLMECVKNKTVSLVNTPGCGVGDSKDIYYFVPRIIEYYLGEDPILKNVETYLCSENMNYVLDNLDHLVVKSRYASGGYGLFIGPERNAQEKQEFQEILRKNPDDYIAQPVVNFSSSPALHGTHNLSARKIDFRPYVLCDASGDIFVLPGGLTRVAQENSLVVNSSQGGGVKDTWVLAHQDEVMRC